ncbi:GFA family protein [Roseobacter weihaiensis]|uniref:GFA family protein n=1 Tax=Roseobacter weihaiensis TaxID=2763262 RepID=UPI001D0A0E93|nr:GFA family protein [Roseobacter sp. H9]
MSEKAEMNGQCLCGAVTVTFVAHNDHLGACHCDMCRRWTGSALLEIDAAPGSLTYEGPVKNYASSEWAERAWCDICGTTLWYHLTVPGKDFYGVSAGLVDNAGGLSLEKEIYIDSKPAGYAFAGAHKKQTKAEFEAEIAALSEGQPQ